MCLIIGKRIVSSRKLWNCIKSVQRSNDGLDLINACLHLFIIIVISLLLQRTFYTRRRKFLKKIVSQYLIYEVQVVNYKVIAVQI